MSVLARNGTNTQRQFADLGGLSPPHVFRRGSPIVLCSILFYHVVATGGRISMPISSRWILTMFKRRYGAGGMCGAYPAEILLEHENRRRQCPTHPRHWPKHLGRTCVDKSSVYHEKGYWHVSKRGHLPPPDREAGARGLDGVIEGMLCLAIWRASHKRTHLARYDRGAQYISEAPRLEIPKPNSRIVGDKNRKVSRDGQCHGLDMQHQCY